MMRAQLILLIGIVVGWSGMALAETSAETPQEPAAEATVEPGPPAAEAPATPPRARLPERAIDRTQAAHFAMERASMSLQPWHDPALRRLVQEGMENVLRMRSSMNQPSTFHQFEVAEARIFEIARQVESTLQSTLLNLENVRNVTWSRFEWTRRTLRRDASTQLARVREELALAETYLAEGRVLNAEASYRQAQFMMSRISLPPGQDAPSFSGQRGGRTSPSATVDAVERLRRDLVSVRRDAGTPPHPHVLPALLRAETVHRSADWLSRFNRTSEAEALIDVSYQNLHIVLNMLESLS